MNEVADHMRYSAPERTLRKTKSLLESGAKSLKSAILGAPSEAERTLELGREFALELKDILRQEGPVLAQKAMKKGAEQLRAQVEKLPVPALFRRAS